MATIQIREVPEAAYEVLRTRARRAGQSLQSYMRDQVISIATQPTKLEAIEQIEEALGGMKSEQELRASILADIAAERC